MKFELVDDMGLYHQQLMNLSLNNIKVKLHFEMGKESAQSFIWRRLGIYEHPYLDGEFS